MYDTATIATSGAWNLFFCSFYKCFGKCLHGFFYPQSIVQVLPTVQFSAFGCSCFLLLPLLTVFAFPLCSLIPTSNSCQISLDNKEIIKLFLWPWGRCSPGQLCSQPFCVFGACSGFCPVCLAESPSELTPAPALCCTVTSAQQGPGLIMSPAITVMDITNKITYPLSSTWLSFLLNCHFPIHNTWR